MPLRDDWASASELIRRLDASLSAMGCRISVLLVDDASTQPWSGSVVPADLHAVRMIRVLRLRRNLGHQRAIALGLVHIERMIECDAVIVMDADGEDTAEGATQLLRAYRETDGSAAIFAERSRRTESLAFRAFYMLYQVLHRCLTGISVRVGNFSILPASYLGTLVVMSELWNHYAAAVFRSRLPFRMVPIARGYRIAGVSRMNFEGLVLHGLSAISVFGDLVGVRLLIGTLLGVTLATLGIGAVGGVRLFTDVEIPGWALYVTATLIVVAIQLITIATSFTMFVLSNRTNVGFVPLRDYQFFVEEAVDVYTDERV